MGTQGIMGFRVDSVDKLSRVQFDAYPHGLGERIVAAIREMLAPDNGLDVFRGMARALRVLKESELTPDERAFHATHMVVNMPGGLPCEMPRATPIEGDLIQTLIHGAIVDASHLASSAACEWAYVVNLDACAFEVYQGALVHSARGRYANMPLVTTFPIRDIPPDWIEQTWFMEGPVSHARG